MSCLTAILLIIGVCSLLSHNCKLLLCTATVCLQPHNPWSQVIKSYSLQHASPAKMLPTLAKDFYLPPQHRHGTSVMLSIFCSVLLCFMGLCKGSRLTGWADLDFQPARCMCSGWGDIKATGQPGTRPCGIISQPQNTQTPHLQIHRKTSCSTHAGNTCCAHMQRIITAHSAGLR